MRIGLRVWKWNLKPGVELYAYLKSWGFGKQTRLNGSLMWGWNPYVSYRLGPFELRKYQDIENNT